MILVQIVFITMDSIRNFPRISGGKYHQLLQSGTRSRNRERDNRGPFSRPFLLHVPRSQGVAAPRTIQSMSLQEDWSVWHCR